MAPRLLIATGNPGKMREYAGLLRDIPLELVSLRDLAITHEVEETGETFEENAWLKASEYAAISGLLTLADDSGLEVDALSGEPGVRSARYGGDACSSDAERVALLLKNLEGVAWEERSARFRCVIAI
ncbi:MAG: non-canonical purine NTP pyrophosphatase, partial [Chloroflexi bacterium]|nr:non-canonical purine NTP pyrophosphatase [Chloroflexota bacterium]